MMIPQNGNNHLQLPIDIIIKEGVISEDKEAEEETEEAEDIGEISLEEGEEGDNFHKSLSDPFFK